MQYREYGFGECVDGVTQAECNACDHEVCTWHAGTDCENIECGGTIPTVSEWGMVVLALLLLIGGKLRYGWAGREPEIA